MQDKWMIMLTLYLLTQVICNNHLLTNELDSFSFVRDSKLMQFFIRNK